MAENLENNTGAVETTETENQEVKTYTQEEVDALLQKETDRRVSAALKKQEKKNADKVREAERLANMTAEQRYEETLKQREAAIEAKERELALAENKNACAKILSEKGLSLDLVEFVVADDADMMDENIKKLEKAFKASVKTEVEKRLGSSVPKKNLPMETTMTKEKFQKLNYTELMKLKTEQPELFAELSK